MSSAPPAFTDADVEEEVERLFGGESTRLVIRVQSEDADAAARHDALRELLDSLAMYDYASGRDLRIAPPSGEDIARGLSVLGSTSLQRKLFHQILIIFGRGIVDPLGAILDTTPGGALLGRLTMLRANVLNSIAGFKLTRETRDILVGDVEKLLTDDYLAMVAEHEEKVQRPKVIELAQQVLHLVGAIFQRAFSGWSEHAKTIATSVSRRIGPSVSLRENPVVIRGRIVEGIEEYLWVETSTELSGALAQLLSQRYYAELVDGPLPTIDRAMYRAFAEACWELVEQNC
jgi:hypothetical protein